MARPFAQTYLQKYSFGTPPARHDRCRILWNMIQNVDLAELSAQAKQLSSQISVVLLRSCGLLFLGFA
jgi:hypothetical protein